MRRRRDGSLYPPLPRYHLDRPAVLAALDRAAAHRVLLVSAGAGFGKSTQLSAWARLRGAGWYTVDAGDRDLTTFAAGIAAVAGRHSSVGTPPAWPGVLGPQGGGVPALEATAGALADLLEPSEGGDFTLVLDDGDRLPPDSPGAGLLASLCRQASDRVHLVIAGRTAPPGWPAGLRGRGVLAEVDAALLAFSAEETAALVVAALGADSAELAVLAHEITGGWPAALQILVEALDRVDPADRPARLAALQHPGESLVEYLSEEVVAGLDLPVRELLRTVSAVPSFTAPICRAVGLAVDDAILRRLARHGLLVRLDDGDEPAFRVRPLLAVAVRACLSPPEPPTARVLREAAARWFAGHGNLPAALQAARSLDDPVALVQFLHCHGDALLTAGETAAVADAIESVPADLATPELARLTGEVRRLRGDWQGAMVMFRRATADLDRLPPGLAWRMGVIHYLGGELDEAQEVFLRGTRCDMCPPDQVADLARLLSWIAAVHWLRNEQEMCRRAAAEALELATACGDDAALAAAHTARGMVAAAEGDQAGNVLHYGYARSAAARAGDVLALVRVRNNIGSRLLEEGRYRAAAAEFEEVVALAELTGHASPLAIALHNRGLANTGLGRLDEAITDLNAALNVYRELGSRMAAYPLMRLGDIHRVRGDLHQARAAYEHAVADADATGDAQGMVPALAGLGRVLAIDDPSAATALIDRALACGPGVSQAETQLAAGWIALVGDDPGAALAWAQRAAATARLRGQLPRLAEAIELSVLASPRPRDESARLGEAAALWRQTGHVLGELTNGFLTTRLEGRPGSEVGHLLRALGVRVDATARHAAGALWWLARDHPAPTVAVQTLGTFLVLRDGTPVSAEQWRSQKARGVLKILIARHGRPVAREVVAEALWQDEAPGPVANRLSVALSTLRTVLDPLRQEDIDRYVRADKAVLALGELDVDVLAFLRTARAGMRLRSLGEAAQARIVLTAAQVQYTGDFLEDEPYADWAVPLREEARALYLQVTRSLTELCADAGDTDDAVQHLLRLLAHDPFDEPAHLRLVGILRAAGRHGEARRRYRTYLRRMAELGVDPAPYR